MDVDSAGLRALLALAEELHFGRAAARLRISQQALSKRLARLEDQFSTTLVDRSDRRNVRLTARGHDILPLARDVVHATDRLTSRLTQPSGRLRVDIMGDYLAPKVWCHRAARNARLAIDVAERPPGTTADHLLAAGEADFAFGRAGAVPQPWPPDLKHRLILLEPLALMVSSTHPWANRRQVAMSELAGSKLWFPLSGAPVEWRTYLAEFAEAFEVAFDTVGSTFGYQQWVDDIARGDDSPSIVGEAMPTPGLGVASVSITDPTPVFPWSLFWRDGTTPERVQELLEAIGFPHRVTTPLQGVWLPQSDVVAA